MNDKPEPASKPVQIRMPLDTLGKAKAISIREHRSLSSVIVVAIEEKYERDIEGK